MTQEKRQYVQLIKGSSEHFEQALLEIMLPDDRTNMFLYGATRSSKRRKHHEMCYSLSPRQ